MTHDEYTVAVAARNGRPQRLVSIDRKDGTTFRDNVSAESSIARKRLIGRAAEKFGVEFQTLDWLDDALVSEADKADAEADLAASEGDREERKSQATQLVELGVNAELFHDPDGEAFARFSVDEHFEVAGVRTRQFRRWLARAFYLLNGKVPSSQAMQDAIGVLEGNAIFEGDKRTVHARVAGKSDRIYLDLCNTAWQVVEITASGWRVLDESPVMFRRAKAMLPLPLPMRGGSIEELRRFIHLEEDEWILFVSCLVAALRPTGPYPVLDLQGEHGSGKSTACRMARALIDPNTAMLRSEPKEPRDLMIASKNGWIISLDNLSGIQPWLSDCLCRLSTGGGFSTRTLYENDEETIFDAQRPVVINGIDDVATRADLLDRCLLLTVPRMEQGQRRPEAELWAEFDEAQPRILGALLSAVSVAMRNVDRTQLSALPRMADFAIWATAAEPGLGIDEGQFMLAYQANRDAGNAVALEASPVGKSVIDLVESVGQWSGTSTDLLRELESIADEKTKRLKSWPSSARSLGTTLKRIAPNLREAGIDVEFGHEGRGKQKRRCVSLARRTEGASCVPNDPNVPTTEIPDFCGDVGDATDGDGDVVGTFDGVDVTPYETTVGTTGDDGDAEFASTSNDQLSTYDAPPF